MRTCVRTCGHACAWAWVRVRDACVRAYVCVRAYASANPVPVRWPGRRFPARSPGRGLGKNAIAQPIVRPRSPFITDFGLFLGRSLILPSILAHFASNCINLKIGLDIPREVCYTVSVQ